MKNFLTTADFSQQELMLMIEKAIAFKNGNIEKIPAKILTLIFANPSLRTRLSFESGIKKLGGHANVLNANDSWDFEYQEGTTMDANTQEHIKEAAPVISNFSDVIGLRKSELMTKNKNQKIVQTWRELREDTPLNTFAKYSKKPLINMESNMFHPCQSMADMMTIVEKHPTPQNKKYVITWAPHPKPLPLATPHSQLITPTIFGLDVTLAYPQGFNLDPDIEALAKEKSAQNGGSLTITNDQQSAFENADIIVAKSWASLEYFGKWEAEKQHRSQFPHWIIDQEKMNLTNNAYFMHCLPVRRNVVVTDEVIDSPQSHVIQQAENRMWIQMAIVSYLLNQ